MWCPNPTRYYSNFIWQYSFFPNTHLQTSMAFQLPLSKPSQTSNLVPTTLLILILTLLVLLHFPHKDLQLNNRKKKCNIFSGEWVPNGKAPYYTNATCGGVIHELQNCMKYGRPDVDFMKWKWKPHDCELPIFNPFGFLEMMRGKSMAFVGDSLARNHMQSLICLLSTVAPSENATNSNIFYQNSNYNFTISLFFSAYLIRMERPDPFNYLSPNHLFLDEPDPQWTSRINSFDYIIISGGAWFHHPAYFYLNRTLTGCIYCPESNITHTLFQYSYRWAFRTAFRAINAAANFRGVTILRTVSQPHFEGGEWNNGGDCVRTRPFKRNEIDLDYNSVEMRGIQMEELGIARIAGRGTGRRFGLLDVTEALLLRGDGHPSKYGRWPIANRTFANDCLHWCLPGPIDSMNDLLQELIKTEFQN